MDQFPRHFPIQPEPCEPPRDSSLVPRLYQEMAPGFSLTPSDHLLCALYGNPVNYFILVVACFTASSMLYYGIISTRYDHQTMLKASASVSDLSGVVREVGDVLFATVISDEIQVDGISQCPT